jgi:hypothetical protein
MHKGTSIKPAVVAQTAVGIADLCGIGSENIPSETFVQGTEESNDNIGQEFPFNV